MVAQVWKYTKTTELYTLKGWLYGIKTTSGINSIYLTVIGMRAYLQSMRGTGQGAQVGRCSRRYIYRVSITRVLVIKLKRYKTKPGLLVMKCRSLGPHLHQYESTGLGRPLCARITKVVLVETAYYHLGKALCQGNFQTKTLLQISLKCQ